MPESNFHFLKNNAFTDKFWGRVDLHAGAPLYFFSKESHVQNMIHQLKYGGKSEIGVILGRKFGASLARSPLFCEVDLIVPVPLHIKKERIRGYNQSAMFAQGLSESMKRPHKPDALKRVVHSQSQTKKSREERLHNVGEAFEVRDAKLMAGKHILLVDDVLTTGATLETCANKILELPDTKLSMATIAMAMH